MIANQDSEDDTRGGGAHGPPLSCPQGVILGDRSTEGAETPPATGTAPKKHLSNTKANLSWDPEGCPVAQPALSRFHKIKTETADNKKNSTQPRDKQTLLSATGKHLSQITQWLKAVVRGPPRGGGRAQAPLPEGTLC